MKKTLLIALVTMLSLSCSSQNHELKLWYNTPAQQWTDALPLGNGRLGAMVFGTPAQERIQINEETIWGGGPHNNVNMVCLIRQPVRLCLILTESPISPTITGSWT